MTPKVFYSLGAAALVSLIAAGAVHSISSPWDSGFGSNGRVLPGLAGRLGDAERLEIFQSGRSLTIASKGERWMLEDRGGYLADGVKVRQNLIGLSELTRLEAKTRKPELYPQIEVEEPTGDGARSRDVKVLSGNGETLARLILGKTRARVLGASKGGVYVRMPEEAQSWLAAGEVAISTDLGDWLDTRLTRLPVDTIEQVTVSRGITYPLKLIRVPGENRGFAVEDLPQGMTAKSEFALQSEIRKVLAVDFDDVRPALDQAGPDARMTMVGTDGLSISFELREAMAGASWVRVSASGQGASAKQEARAINERYSGFEMHLGPEDSDDFTLKLADVVDVESG